MDLGLLLDTQRYLGAFIWATHSNAVWRFWGGMGLLQRVAHAWDLVLSLIGLGLDKTWCWAGNDAKCTFVSHFMKSNSENWCMHIRVLLLSSLRKFGKHKWPQRYLRSQWPFFPKIPWVRLVMWNVVFMKKLNVISEASGFLLFTGESKNGDKILMISIYKFVWRLINSKQFINKVNIEDETQEVVNHDMW